MLAAHAPVCFPAMPARKRDTKQLGHRIDAMLVDRMISFSVRHPMQPSIATILERAVAEWLDREEPKLPVAAKPPRK